MSTRSLLEALYLQHLLDRGLPTPQREYKFMDDRGWRFDFAWPAIQLAVEIEGATRQGGRHTRHEGFSSDCEKYNAAAADDWTLLRFTGEMVKKGYAAVATEAVLMGTTLPAWKTWSALDMRA